MPTAARDEVVASMEEAEARRPLVAQAQGALVAAIESLKLSAQRAFEEAAAARGHAVSLDTTRLRVEAGKGRLLVKQVIVACEQQRVDLALREAVEGVAALIREGAHGRRRKR